MNKIYLYLKTCQSDGWHIDMMLWMNLAYVTVNVYKLKLYV